jgi:hypothetical protein
MFSFVIYKRCLQDLDRWNQKRRLLGTPPLLLQGHVAESVEGDKEYSSIQR